MVGPLHGGHEVLRAAARCGSQGAGRCAFDDDGPHHRRLHQHHDGQAVLAYSTRSTLRAERDGGVSANRVPPDAHGHWLRDRQPRPQHGLIASTAGVTLWLWTQGRVGVGAVAAATAMALRLNGISHWVMWEMASLFEQIGTVQDGISTLARSPAVLDRPDAQPLRVTRGDIRFEGVTFAYGASSSALPIIDNLNLHIRPGEKIGLVGRSGAGKSTIVNLLLRFYDIPQGRVLIDGQDISLATQDSLRAQIGMVTQDTSLLHRSVSDNIRYGRPDAGDAEMEAAAKRAEAHDFIVNLTDPKHRVGYQAHVGERGVKLSGGQRQRIAIARGMFKDAPIL